jgi:hypothetical protein
MPTIGGRTMYEIRNNVGSRKCVMVSKVLRFKEAAKEVMDTRGVTSIKRLSDGRVWIYFNGIFHREVVN